MASLADIGAGILGGLGQAGQQLGQFKIKEALRKQETENLINQLIAKGLIEQSQAAPLFDFIGIEQSETGLGGIKDAANLLEGDIDISDIGSAISGAGDINTVPSLQNEIRVRRISDGAIGRIPINEFDPVIYERIQ